MGERPLRSLSSKPNKGSGESKCGTVEIQLAFRSWHCWIARRRTLGRKCYHSIEQRFTWSYPHAAGLSKSNIYYCRKFYLLYKDALKTFHQLGGKNETELFHQVGGIFEVPWRHHCLIMDKVKDDIDKALFYVHQTVENGWSRSMLLNFISTDLYERQGKPWLTLQKHCLMRWATLHRSWPKTPTILLSRV